MYTELFDHLTSGEINIKRLRLALQNIKNDEREKIIKTVSIILAENHEPAIVRNAIILLASFFGNKLKRSLAFLYKNNRDIFEIAINSAKISSCKDIYNFLRSIEIDSEKYQIKSDDEKIEALLENKPDISSIITTVSSLNSRSYPYYVIINRTKFYYKKEISFLYFSISKAIPSFCNYVKTIFQKLNKLTTLELRLLVELINIDFPSQQSSVDNFVVSCFDFAERVETALQIELSDNFFKIFGYLGRQNELSPFLKLAIFNNVLNLLFQDLSTIDTYNERQSFGDIILTELFTESLFDYLLATKNLIVAQFTKDIFTNCFPCDENDLDFNSINKMLMFFGYKPLKKTYLNKITNPKKTSGAADAFHDAADIELIPVNQDAVKFEKYISIQEKDIHQKYQNLRPEQSKFRASVLSRYGVKCAVCNIRIESLIESAHIIGKSEGGGTDDPLNGLPLCSLHHKAFDTGLFCIHPQSMKIIPRPGKFSTKELLITIYNIKDMPTKPANDTLIWRWNKLVNEF